MEGKIRPMIARKRERREYLLQPTISRLHEE